MPGYTDPKSPGTFIPAPVHNLVGDPDGPATIISQTYDPELGVVMTQWSNCVTGFSLADSEGKHKANRYVEYKTNK